MLAEGGGASLTAREADLLAYLVRRPGVTVSRDQLLTDVWGYSDQVVSRAADATIRRLRTKIEEVPARPVHILTMHGEGYRFIPIGFAPDAPEAPHQSQRRVLVLGAVRVDLGTNQVLGPGEPVTLSALEARLLQCLLSAGGATVPRRSLLRQVWDGGSSSPRAVDLVVRRLRTKIEAEPSAPAFLLSVRGQGYRFEVPETPEVVDAPAAFFGRAEELTSLRDMLAETRCVVVVGPGGMGKTRLCRRYIATAGQAPSWWVDAGTARTPAEVVVAVAHGIGVEARVAGLAAEVGANLAQEAGGLLVVDEVEAVGDGIGPLLEAWLEAAPRLRIIATSRQRVELRPG